MSHERPALGRRAGQPAADLVRGGPSRELAVVRRALRAGGRLGLFLHPPLAASADAFAARAAPVLPAAGFRVERVLREKIGGSAAVGVLAAPAT